MASEYGWPLSEIENLTYRRMTSFLSVIEKRQEQAEYLDRLHIGLQAIAITKAIGAAFDQSEITIEELIGGPPGAETGPRIDTQTTSSGRIEEWKQAAQERGLKTGSNLFDIEH
jgi:hypothetical protein